MKYKIERPPLVETFFLPPKETLLKLKLGDLVKVMFKIDNEEVERMWVKIIKQQDHSEWTGELDNDPKGQKMSEILKSGDEVIFHPLDIVQIFEEKN